MISPEGGSLLHQTTPYIVFHHLDCPLHLPIGLSASNGDVVVNNSKPLTDPFEASHKLGTIGCPDIVRLTLVGDTLLYSNSVAP